MNKFFTLEVKPEITAAKQSLGAFDDGDVIADWFAFDIPNGGNLLRDAFLVTKPTDGTRQTHAVEAYFAKTIDGFPPQTLGSVHGTADGTVANCGNHILAFLETEEDEEPAGNTDNITIQRFQFRHNLFKTYGPSPNIVLQGEPNTGTTKGFSRLYVALTAIDGDVNFASTVQCDGVQTTGQQFLTVKTTSARANFGLGDVLVDEDDRLLGTIAGSNTLINNTNIPLVDAGLQNDTVNNKDVYSKAPMRLILSFER
tara:strand:+ start:30 stop:797 length:768 start_codon:yes stop_codon:yes gene_type:complete